MSEHQYVHSAEKDNVELERLTVQASVYDPVTIRHLKTLGVSDGWRCLEVGAGAGSIAQWLSEQVIPAGRVVATDIDPRFLQRISAPNLEIRRHDILADELEDGEYDLVHCRLLLKHLPEPEKALKKMANAVRPGGWLLVEDDDWGSVLSMDVTDPSLVSFVAGVKDVLDCFRKKGVLDDYFGRRLRGLVEQLGYEDVGQEGWTCIMHGGDPLARAEEGSFLTMVSAGLLTREQFESVHRLRQDPTFYWPGCTMFSAWGRKPVNQE